MADIDTAFKYLMVFEDDGMTGRVTKDDGGRTRFGIAEKFHPALTDLGFFDDMPKDGAILLAKATYEQHEWRAMQGNEIYSQPLANKLLSLGVNLGMGTVIRWAQDVAEIAADGAVGPKTLAAFNANAGEIFRGISLDAEAHYRQRAKNKPALQMYLKGWLRRAQDSAEAA
jgi:lysozyme family protein